MMNTCIAFLRGINVSGQKIIKMSELKAAFEDSGYVKPATYIQSGNVVFDSSKNIHADTASDISAMIRIRFGFEVTVIVKTTKELSRIIAENPFPAETGTGRLYATLLSENPSTAAIKELAVYDNGVDAFIFQKSVIYTVYGRGMGKSEFSNNFIEKKLKVAATTRNWNTLVKLLSMTGGG